MKWLWEVELSEWHLVGPMLLSLIVCLSQRMRLSRRRIQEFLHDWLGVALSASPINQYIHEAGRAVEPIEAQLVEALQQALLAYADETPWKEWGQLLWLWVITTPTVCLYFIGYPSQDRLKAFVRLCEQHRDSAHEKSRALVREFLNDWEAIWIVVAHPHLPLTNNEAEKALRHGVIARRLSQGTRTEQGRRVVALLASVIDACRKRHILPWPY